MKKNLAVVGLQWGDEGKGKIVDILAEEFDCVARYQGGHNAGHTVSIGGRRHVLHLIPSGIFHEGVLCVVGNGVVLDPAAFLEELEGIRAAGIVAEGRLFISNRCHLILPYHRAIEAVMEERLGDAQIGTTSRGIGPAYEDKVARRGLRSCDLLNLPALAPKIRNQVEFKNCMLEALGDPERIDAEPICAVYEQYAAKLQPFIVDASALLNRLIRDGRKLLFEGAQAALLDIDHGTFPFVTSSSASAGGIATGLGVAPREVHGVVGVLKAYITRVGTGPFPTEATEAQAESIRSRGNEYGSTTGRPRRCGWFDGPAARYASMINGLESVVVTKLDVLDQFAEIPFCVGYKYKGTPVEEFPADAAVLDRIEPVYKMLPGWNSSTAGVREFAELPGVARDYLKFLSDYLEVPLSMVSTGPGREETIRL